MLQRLLNYLFARETSSDTAEMIIANCLSDFALKLFQLDYESNEIFCPNSIFIALSMVYFGSRGQTRSQLGKLLYGKCPENETIGKEIKKLMHALQSVDKSYAKVVWSVANRMYVNQSFTVRQAFKDELEKELDAEILPMDISKEDELCKEINAWVAKKTNDKITSVISSVEKDTALILINAVYFKAAWHTSFLSKNTKKEKFHCSESKTITVSMMTTKESDFYYRESDDWQLLGMAYTAQHLRMYVLLPKEKFGLSKIEKELTTKMLLDATKDHFKETVMVKLPKFKLEKEVSLENPLTKLGAADMFDKVNANLQGISDRPIRVSHILHKTFIDVEEEGTEAAGVTVVKVAVLSARATPARSYEFIADHPFMFFILDIQSKVILFMGRYLG